MARDWPFFSTLVDDVEMVLAKSDLGIFERYSLLAGELESTTCTRTSIPASPPSSSARARRCSRSRARDELLADDQRLRQSIRLRNPYVDPISLLQVDLLARWRARRQRGRSAAAVADRHGQRHRGGHPEHRLAVTIVASTAGAA